MNDQQINTIMKAINDLIEQMKRNQHSFDRIANALDSLNNKS